MAKDETEAAQPGVRVKVRFAGRDVPGFVIERRSGAEHEGRLTPIRTVVSSEPVLTPAILGLAREVAQAYAGTVGDVLRLAVPPRHARAEAALSAASSGARDLDPRAPDATAWEPYPAGAALLRHLESLEKLPVEKLLQDRQRRLASFGEFSEGKA